MRTELRILATRLWVRHAWQASGDTKTVAFIDRFDAYASPQGDDGLKRTQLSEWWRGKRYVSETWVNRFEQAIPGTKWVHAIGTLLTPNRLSANAARGTVSQFFVTEPNNERRWIMLYDGAPSPTEWEDSSALALRGDFFGFIAILVLVREAFACLDYDRLCQHLADLYKLLPSIARIDWVRPDVDLLIQCIESMMAKDIYWLPAHVEIDWQAFREEVAYPRPWAYDPLWIVSKRGDRPENAPNRLLRRPVPLLGGVGSLADYVSPQKNEVQQNKTPQRTSFLDRLLNDKEA